MNTRVLKRISAAIVGGISLIGLVLVTDASPASAHKSREEFACPTVDGTFETDGYCHIFANDGSVGRYVPDGHKLCFGVRGSDGHPVRFRATTSEWTRTTNRGIVAGDGKACLSTNNDGRLLAEIDARTTDGSTLQVGDFTVYVCHPGNPCYEGS
jgi:hypothetical protein